MSELVTAVALRLADEARALGLAVNRLEASRCIVSTSRYVHFRDVAGRLWCLRVSDHGGSRSTRSHPHYDLIFRPNERDEAIEAACGWLARVAEGQVEWRPADRAVPA